MRKLLIGLFLLSTFSILLTAQKATIEGYVFEDGNRGYLNEVAVKIMQEGSNKMIANIATNKDGFFSVKVPTKKAYVIETSKNLFNPQKTTLLVKKGDKNKKVFAKIKMFRQPGYLFDVTMAEKMTVGMDQVDAITGARIEVYNNTTQQAILNYPNHPKPTFSVNFERGNHYSILIRKEGYFAKRMEAFVDVKDCILCFEGVGKVTPGASNVMTEGNKMGTVLANIELQKVILDKPTKLNNIQFAGNNNSLDDAAKAELNKLLTIISNNPNLTFEIGVHTDSRGDDSYNLQQSQEKAWAIGRYLNNSGKVQPNQVIAKGYGETRPFNYCYGNVSCSEELHLQNRRVEWKVSKKVDDNFLKNQTLAQIAEVERFNKGLNFGNQEVYVARSGENLPPDITRDIVSNYDSPSAKYDPNANPDGVAFGNVINTNDPYAEVTNATRLVDENYDDASEREAFKRQPMPTAYNSPMKVDKSLPRTKVSTNRDLPGNYNQGAMDKKIITPPAPEFGETVVATAENSIRTQSIPNYYTGYKIEFLTSLTELPASHEVFRRHGNIAMEQKENGIYSYLLGNFRDKKAAKTFLEEILQARYPNASLVFYENGRRGQKVNTIKVRTKPASAPPR